MEKSSKETPNGPLGDMSYSFLHYCLVHDLLNQATHPYCENSLTAECGQTATVYQVPGRMREYKDINSRT